MNHKTCPCGRQFSRGVRSRPEFERRIYCSVKCSNAATAPTRKKREPATLLGHYWDSCGCGNRMARGAKRCRDCWRGKPRNKMAELGITAGDQSDEGRYS